MSHIGGRLSQGWQAMMQTVGSGIADRRQVVM